MLFLYGLTLMFAMNNCQRIEEPLKSEPSAKLMQQMSDITMKALVPVEPQAVVVTPFTFTRSELTLQFRKDLLNNSSATLPASLQKMVNDMTAAVSESDLETIASADFNLIKKGGELPAALQQAIDRVNNHPSLAPYRATSTLPSVGEIIVPKIVINEPVLTTTFSTDRSSNTCTQMANEAFLAKQKMLDDQRKAEFAALDNMFNQAVVAANTQEMACNNAAKAGFNMMRADANAAAAAEMAAIDANPRFSPILKRVFKARVAADLRDELAKIDSLEKNDGQCKDVRKNSIAAAEVARTAGKVQSNNNFNTAVEAARDVRSAAIADCIYLQGQGS